MGEELRGSPDGAGSYKTTSYAKGSPYVTHFIRAFAAAIVLLGLTATGARADLTIDLSPITPGAGNTGTMDISATTSSGFTLSAFGLELAITSIGSPTTQLQFS